MALRSYTWPADVSTGSKKTERVRGHTCIPAVGGRRGCAWVLLQPHKHSHVARRRRRQRPRQVGGGGSGAAAAAAAAGAKPGPRGQEGNSPLTKSAGGLKRLLSASSARERAKLVLLPPPGECRDE